MRRKTVLLWSGLGAAALAAAGVRFLAPDAAVTPGDVETANSQASAPVAPPKRQPLGRLRGSLFEVPSPPAPPPPPVVAAPPEPAPPPMPYRVAGMIIVGRGAHLILARGDTVLPVQEGDTLDGGYRVEAIRRDAVTLLYVPLGVRQDLPVASTLALDEPRQGQAGAAAGATTEK